MPVDRISKFLLADYKLAGLSDYTPQIIEQEFIVRLLRVNGVSLEVPSAELSEAGIPDVDLEEVFLEHLDRSDAMLVIGCPKAFAYESFYHQVQERLRSGLRIWVDLPVLVNLRQWPEPILSRYLSFLTDIGVEPTDIGLFTDQDDFEHPGTVLVRRSESPGAFRHPALFQGVDKVVLNGASAIKLHGPAQAIVAVEPKSYRLVDRKTDLRVQEWNEPDFAVVSCSYVGDGACYVTSGMVYTDSYYGSTGMGFPGGEENESIWGNLFRELKGNHAVHPASHEQSVHRIVQSIERNLLEIVQALFQDEWPNFVDQSAKDKAESRAQEEGGKLVWWAYLDLADHINTLAKNIVRLKPALEFCGYASSRKKFEKEVIPTGKLIQLRILDSHVTKRMALEYEFSEQDVRELQAVHTRVVRIWRAVTNLRPIR